MSEDLHEIVRRLGGELYAGGRAACIPGPGHSPRDRSLSLTTAEDGRVLFYSHAGDDARSVMDYLGIERAARSGSRSSREETERLRRLRERARRKEEEEALAFCRGVWEGTTALGGTPVEAYLRSRSLEVDHCSEIRFHPAAPRARRAADSADPPPPPHPAMIALARAPDGAPRGIHATFLTPDGRKAFGERSRLMFGPMSGAAVQLAPVGRDGVLAVGEGIETAASFTILRGAPCWAVLSTSGLRAFSPPLNVRRLLIACDSDDKSKAHPEGAGLAAAQALAERASHRCDVEIVPAPDGFDWNDCLQAERCGA